MKEVYCLPKWYLEGDPNRVESKFKAIQIPKNSPEVEEVFLQKYLDRLPEDYVWKIHTRKEPVYRSEEDFTNEFDLVTDLFEGEKR